MTDILASRKMIGKCLAISFFAAVAAAAACGKKPSEGQPAVQAPPPQAQAAAPVAAPAAGASQPAIDDLCYQIRYADDADKIAKLLDSGVPPNGRDRQSGFTPLTMALMPGSGGSEETQAKTVDVLLAHGADVNADNGYAINAAVSSRKTALVRKLLDKGANLNVVAPDKLTPLITAVQTRSLEMVSLLVDGGADPDFKTPEGKNAWYWAFSQAYTYRTRDVIEIEEFLRGRTNRTDLEALLRADKSRDGYFDTEKWLQDHP